MAKFSVKNFLVNLMQILCLIIQETYILVSQNITVYSSDLHDVIIIPTKRQKTLVIDSDTESGGKKNHTPYWRRLYRYVRLLNAITHKVLVK